MQKKAPQNKKASWKGYHQAFSMGALRDHKKSILPYLNRPNGKFVEVGAGGGGADSLTLYLERALGWQGILIEPWPHLFHKCRKKRKHSTALNVAAVDRSMVDSYIEVKGSPPDASIRQELRRAAVERLVGKPALPPTKTKTKKISYISTNSIDGILDRLEFEGDFELLALNLAGYENNALDGFDFERHSPTFILARLDITTKVLPNLPMSYQKIATSKHDRITNLVLFRYADFGAN